MKQDKVPTTRILESDVALLKNYLGLPCKLRVISAETWLTVIRSSPNPLERKTGFVKIYEEYLASTEDLGIFYFALKTLGKYPLGVMKHCLEFELKIAHENEWQADMAAVPEGSHFLTNLNVPSLDDFARIPEPHFDPTVIDSILEKVTKALRAAVTSRRTDERLLVRAYNKMKHGMMIHDAGDQIVLTIPGKGHSSLRLDPDAAAKLVDAVKFLRQATAVVVSFLITSIALGLADGGYDLTQKERLEVAKAFKDVPSPF